MSNTKPLVAVVGRPNVGKSTLFNRIVGQRIAIVKDVPGVTRDRIYADAGWVGHEFTLIDTGGIDPRSEDVLLGQMRKQAEIAMELAQVICFLVDGRTGITPDDMEIANLLRRTGKPIVLAVNKIDHVSQTNEIYDFYQLGMGEPHPVSAANMMGLGDLLDALVSHFPERTAEEAEEEQHVIQLAVVGRPNVGKSSLVNRLLGQERTMVSDIPGTTRDAIDSPLVTADGVPFNIIDTAGMRKKKAIEDASLERYSVLRSIAAIRRCDVALLLLDAQDGVTEQDARIAGMIHDEGKAAVVIMNKWDSIEKDTNTLEKKRKEILDDLKFMDYAPVLFISALTGQRVNTVLNAAVGAWTQTSRRITTGTLNDVLADAQLTMQPPAVNGRRLKIYYATQQSACPPHFVFFVNHEDLMHFSYQRYLENQLRKAFGFEGTPLRFTLREKKKEDAR